MKVLSGTNLPPTYETNCNLQVVRGHTQSVVRQQAPPTGNFWLCRSRTFKGCWTWAKVKGATKILHTAAVDDAVQVWLVARTRSRCIDILNLGTDTPSIDRPMTDRHWWTDQQVNNLTCSKPLYHHRNNHIRRAMTMVSVEYRSGISSAMLTI